MFYRLQITYKIILYYSYNAMCIFQLNVVVCSPEQSTVALVIKRYICC